MLGFLLLLLFDLVELETDFFPLLWLLQEFAVSLRNKVSSMSEIPKIRTLTFVLHACKVLEQARKVRLDKKFRLYFF